MVKYTSTQNQIASLSSKIKILQWDIKSITNEDIKKNKIHALEQLKQEISRMEVQNANQKEKS